MRRRYMCLLAKDYLPTKYKTDASFLSTKLDGMRAIWVPNTRGVNWRSVPFANTSKDGREGLATGLWSRLGKVIHAPADFLDRLPVSSCLDGELWKGPGRFEETSGDVRSLDGDWSEIKYMVFDRPAFQQVYAEGDLGWTTIYRRAEYDDKERRFTDVLIWMRMQKFWDEVVQPTEQVQLPADRVQAEKIVWKRFEEVTNEGHEGLMLRRGHSTWQPYRSDDLVKVKPVESGTGKVIGYNPGEGKYKGMIGSLVLDNGVEISGMLDSQRQLSALGHMMAFAPLQTVHYRFNGYTNSGKPRHPRLARQGED